MERGLYLLITVLTALFPALLGFDQKVRFARTWKKLAISIPTVALLFIVWDAWFTQSGIWGFNEQFISGVRLGNLPLEECLFFFAIPFACMFIYEIVRWKMGVWTSARVRGCGKILAGIVAFSVLFFAEYHYPLVSFTLAAGLLVLAARQPYFGTFVVAYLWHLPPFLLVNGILTAVPIVLYNPQEIIGLRIGTIPVEDLTYSFSLFFLNVMIREALERK